MIRVTTDPTAPVPCSLARTALSSAVLCYVSAVLFEVSQGALVFQRGGRSLAPTQDAQVVAGVVGT
ncbi:MAG TPA: hypothetical protein VEA99_11760, partial [Gemmatimonadaceae bacterium]|nr:hypothetical protein [Gemmatimonadaceae bacterium]